MRNTNLCPPSYNNRKRLKRFYRRFFSTPQELTDFVNQVMENDAGLVMANQVQRFVDLSRENQGNYHSRSDFLTISYCRICLESFHYLSTAKNNNDFWGLFADIWQKNGFTNIKDHFVWYKDANDSRRPEVTAGAFLTFMRDIRNIAFHEGKCWYSVVFSKSNNLFVVEGEKETYYCCASFSYTDFEFSFVKGCIGFIKEYCANKEDKYEQPTTN